MKRKFLALVVGFLLAGSSIAQGAGILLQQGVCGGFNSRLHVGDSAVSTSPALNIRSSPSTTADRLRDPLEPGTPVTLLEGPQCVDGYTWWRVSAAGIQGWVAEGNPTSYFLSAPVDPNQTGQSGTTGTTGTTGTSGTSGTTGTGGNANPNPPLTTLDGRPGGGNYEYVCRGGWDGITGRDPATSSDVGFGGTIAFTPSLNMLEVDTPAICLDANTPFSGGVAVAPNGQTFDASVTPVYEDNGDGGSDYRYTMAQLPLQAFFMPGTWQLQASGFSLNVNVRLPNHPYVLYTFLNGEQMIVGGLQPNERFIANGTGDDGETVRWFEARADGGGAYVTQLDQLPWYPDLFNYDTNALYLSATQTDIIGQQGSFMTLKGVTVSDPDTGYEWYRIPTAQAAPLMREIVWGGNYDDISAQALLRSWTCPGAPPIRLNLEDNGGGAHVIDGVGTVNLYNQPTFNSQVVGSVQSGDSVFLLDGVQCADNAIWWDVGDGWIAESVGSSYLLDQ